MPAPSRSSQRLWGWVHAVQKGEAKNAPAKIKSMANRVDPQDATDFAKTKHEGLPEKVAADLVKLASTHVGRRRLAAALIKTASKKGILKLASMPTTSPVSQNVPISQLANPNFKNSTILGKTAGLRDVLIPAAGGAVGGGTIGLVGGGATGLLSGLFAKQHKDPETGEDEGRLSTIGRHVGRGLLSGGAIGATGGGLLGGTTGALSSLLKGAADRNQLVGIIKKLVGQRLQQQPKPATVSGALGQMAGQQAQPQPQPKPQPQPVQQPAQPANNAFASANVPVSGGGAGRMLGRMAGSIRKQPPATSQAAPSPKQATDIPGDTQLNGDAYMPTATADVATTSPQSFTGSVSDGLNFMR